MPAGAVCVRRPPFEESLRLYANDVSLTAAQSLVVLVLLDVRDTGSATCADALRSRLHGIAAEDTECALAHQSVASILPPAVVIADRWGEIAAIATADRAAELPMSTTCSNGSNTSGTSVPNAREKSERLLEKAPGGKTTPTGNGRAN